METEYKVFFTKTGDAGYLHTKKDSIEEVVDPKSVKWVTVSNVKFKCQVQDIYWDGESLSMEATPLLDVLIRVCGTEVSIPIPLLIKKFDVGIIFKS